MKRKTFKQFLEGKKKHKHKKKGLKRVLDIGGEPVTVAENKAGKRS